MVENTDETQVTLDVPGEDSFPAVDYSEFTGSNVKIEKVTTHMGKVFEGRQSYYVKLQTGLINPEETDSFKQVKATKILGLSTKNDEEGNEIVFWTPNSKMANFLKSKGIKHFRDAEGMEVKVKTTEPNAEGKEFLTF